MKTQSPAHLDNDTDPSNQSSLLDFIDLEELQQLQDDLAGINGVSFVITDPNGNLLTMPSGDISVCRLFRMSSQGEAVCLGHMQSVALGVKRDQAPVCLKSCPLGILNAAAPILLGNVHHVATLWVRKSCICPEPHERLLHLDGFDGVNADRLKSELASMEHCDPEDFNQVVGWLNSFSQQISQMGHQRVTLARHAGELKKLEAELDRYKSQMVELVNARTADLLSANKRLQLEVLERDLAEEQIARKSKLIDAINQVLQQTLSESGEHNLSQTFLRAAQEITASSFGFVVENNDGRWQITATTSLSGVKPTSPVPMSYEPFEPSGIWQKVLDGSEPMVVNHPEDRLDWQKLPKHFPSFENLLAVPLLKDDRAMGLVSLANSSHAFSPIDSGDISALGQAFMGALMRKRMEVAKYQSEQRLNLAMDSANQGLWDYFPQNGNLYFSPSWFTMLGYHAYEFPTGMETWTTLTHPNDVSSLEIALDSVALGDENAFGIEIRMLGKEGHWRWINARGRAVEYDRDKAVVRVIGTLTDISKYKRIEMALQKANEELQRLAALDDLTQIANRRRFDDRLTQEWRRARRDGKPLALVICDIDFFKNYNDTYGHLKGDDTLHMVAQTLSDMLKRPMDLVARFGGEEFAAILPNTNIKGAMRVAHEFRAAIDGLKIEHRASAIGGQVTLSFGVAAMIPDGAMQPKSLIEAADKALYKAKALGRNAIVKMSSQALEADETTRAAVGQGPPKVPAPVRSPLPESDNDDG
jgi:diguanylate cyclase (GGDEF)-like protein/PAS domain S-box-containing protein